MFIEDVDNKKEFPTNSISSNKNFNYFSLFLTRIWLLLPLSQVQAINFAAYFVFVPKNMNEHFDSSIILIATMALAYSMINPVSTYLVGILFNKTVRARWILFVVSIFFSLMLSILLIYIFEFYEQERIYDYVLISIFGFLYGIYDSIIYTINMIVMGELFHENIFCVQRIFYCLNVIIFVQLVKILENRIFLFLLILLNILSLIGYLILTNECYNTNKHNYEEIRTDN